MTEPNHGGEQRRAGGLSALVVTDSFPPLNAIGVHRTVGLCQHLVKEGWRVTVLTCPEDRGVGLDHELLHSVPSSVRVIRTRAWHPVAAVSRLFRRRAVEGKSRPGALAEGIPGRAPSPRGWLRTVVEWITWWFHIPDNVSGWIVPAIYAGWRACATDRPDAIFSTAPSWSSHVVAMVLARVLRIPWVADFRDPWCGSAWRSLPFRAHRAIDGWLEWKVIHSATSICCAWDGITKHLQARYPDRKDDITTILNGFDPSQFEGIDPEPIDSSKIVLLHAGTLYGPRSPIPVFQGLARLRDESPEAARRLLVAFVGSPVYDGRSMTDLVEQHSLTDLIRLIPRVSHARTLALLKGSPVGILLGQGGQPALSPVPAKTYDYVATNKAVLALGAGEEVLSILRDGGCRVWSAPAGDTALISQALMEISRFDFSCASAGTPRQLFTRQEMARKLEAAMRAAMASPGSRGPNRSATP